MRPCSYCGRENEQIAAQCHECGTELQPTIIPESSVGPSFLASLRQPAHIAWLAAALIFVQASVQFGFSPYDPSLGDGNIERVEATIWFWKSFVVSIVLISLGRYLRSNGTDE
jgi:hypothetical protein